MIHNIYYYSSIRPQELSEVALYEKIVLRNASI
jgi:hypothetical protein